MSTHATNHAWYVHQFAFDACGPASGGGSPAPPRGSLINPDGQLGIKTRQHDPTLLETA